MVKDERPGQKVIHPRIPADIHTQVSAYAARTHRTFNGAVVALLEIALAAEQGPQTPGDPSPVHYR